MAGGKLLTRKPLKKYGRRTKNLRVYCKQAKKHKLRFRGANDATEFRTTFEYMSGGTPTEQLPYWCAGCSGYHLYTKKEFGFGDGEAP